MEINYLPVVAKSACKVSIYRRMSAILEMTFIQINVVKCIFVFAWSQMHTLPCVMGLWLWRIMR